MDPREDPLGLRQSRRRARIWIVGGLLHVALFGGFLVYPYTRGDARAAEARRAFGPFAACFYGGEATGAAGLALPAGERAHLASLWLSAEGDWPDRCRDPLFAIAKEEAMLLFPSVKDGEARVRAAVAEADRALASAARERARGEPVVPIEVIEAVTGVAAALSELARAVDPHTPFTDEAIRFTSAPSAPEPARIALNAAHDAAVRMRVVGGGVEVVAVDARGVSHSVVREGRTRTIRMVRPGLVRGALFDADGPVAVFATSASRCAAQEDACARRASAALPFAFEPRMGEPRWLAAHPAGRFDRAVRVGERGEVAVLAVGGEGEGVVLRRFGGGEGASGSEGASEREGASESEEERGSGPVRAVEESRLEGAVAAVLVGEEVLFAEVVSGSSAFFLAGGERRQVVTLEGVEPWMVACAHEGGGHALVATDVGAALVAFDSGGARTLATIPLDELSTAPLDERDPMRDRVKLACDATGVALLAHAADGRLRARVCDGGACGEHVELGRVAAFDVARAGGRTIVATSSGLARAAVVVRDLAEPAGRVVAACFSDGEGLCGYPLLATNGERLVLATRERNDMTAIESRDAGRTWRAMEGVR
jgi:hypothetical protein